MARRGITTDRLILALGVVVVALGAVVLWAALHGGGFGAEETASARVRRQVRDRNPAMQVVYTEVGRTPGVLCGYAGPTRRARAHGLKTEGWKFISRKSRILFDTDPLTREFADEFASECPQFLENPLAPTP